MNTVFLLLFLLSLLGFFIFTGRALINFIKKNPIKKNLKTAGISAIVCIASLAGFGFTMEIIDPESIELSIPDYQNEYDINAKIPLEVSMSPENADKVHFKYISSGDTLTFSDSRIKTGSEPGIYEIHIESGNVKSNTLSITVVDMAARKAEQEAAEKQASEQEEKEASAKEEDSKSTAKQEIPTETQSGNETPKHKDSDPKTTVTAPEKPKENPADTPAKESEEDPTDAPDEEEEDPFGFNVIFSSTYRNDVTGNWRLARIAEDIDIENYAVEYYKHYFDSDNEVHIIINFTRNTTTRINKFGNLLDVTIMDYVKGEEHDAEVACSGTLLSEYFVDIDSGEIEKIQ